MAEKDLMFQPKGGMCSTCDNKHRDCSFLDFSSMPVIQSYIGVKVVKCSEHKKLSSDGREGQHT